MPDSGSILWFSFCAVLGALVAVIAYLGVRIHCKLDEMSKALVMIATVSQKEVTNLREEVFGEIAGVDKRVAVIEATCKLHRSGVGD